MAQISKIYRDGFEASLSIYCVDHDRRIPVYVGFTGIKNAVKALISRARDDQNIGVGGAGDAHNFAFFLQREGEPDEHFRLPDSEYKSFAQDLGSPAAMAEIIRNKRKRPSMYEGRLISYKAVATLAGPAECYVPVWREIDIPNVPDTKGLDTKQQWAQYIEYTERPNAAEFKGYTAPVWAEDLYNLYMYLSNRVRIPMSPHWMPWVFKEVANRRIWQSGKETVLVKYFKNQYTNPLLLEKEKQLGRPVVEHGCYRLICDDAKDVWRSTLMQNPNLLAGIDFN